MASASKSKKVNCRLIVIGLALCAVWPQRAWSDTGEVCNVGAQLHLQNGVPDETYLRHLRAFVEEDMADYVLLLAVWQWSSAHGLQCRLRLQ